MHTHARVALAACALAGACAPPATDVIAPSLPSSEGEGDGDGDGDGGELTLGFAAYVTAGSEGAFAALADREEAPELRAWPVWWLNDTTSGDPRLGGTMLLVGEGVRMARQQVRADLLIEGDDPAVSISTDIAHVSWPLPPAPAFVDDGSIAYATVIVIDASIDLSDLEVIDFATLPAETLVGVAPSLMFVETDDVLAGVRAGLHITTTVDVGTGRELAISVAAMLSSDWLAAGESSWPVDH